MMDSIIPTALWFDGMDSEVNATATRDVRQTLKQLVENCDATYAGLSVMLGRNPAYLQQFVMRGTPKRLSEEDRQILARYFGVPQEILGKSTHTLGQPRQKQSPSTVFVPRLSIGEGHQVLPLERQGASVFDGEWLCRLGLDYRRLSVVTIDGEAMAPALQPGDDILVDHADGAARLRDGLYLIKVHGALLARRILIGSAKGRCCVSTDHPLYPDWTEFDPTLLSIEGRIVWVGRKVR